MCGSKRKTGRPGDRPPRGVFVLFLRFRFYARRRLRIIANPPRAPDVYRDCRLRFSKAGRPAARNISVAGSGIGAAFAYV